jgi:hypothetical protein
MLRSDPRGEMVITVMVIPRAQCVSGFLLSGATGCCPPCQHPMGTRQPSAYDFEMTGFGRKRPVGPWAAGLSKRTLIEARDTGHRRRVRAK